MAVTTAAFTSVGTTIGLVAAAPTAATKAGYEALTYIEVGEVDSIGDIVVSREVQSRVPLKTGITTKTKGATNFEPFTVSGAWASGDQGQVMVKAALEANTAYSYCISYADGSKEYGRGLITSRGKNPGDANAFTGMTFTIDPTGAALEVAMI
jgi:hypothetical protein